MKKLLTTIAILFVSAFAAFAGPHEEIQKALDETEWVRDVYIDDLGILNIGVFAEEKTWDAPMIAAYVNGIIERSGATDIRMARFVDIRKIAHQNLTPRQASIFSWYPRH